MQKSFLYICGLDGDKMFPEYSGLRYDYTD